MDIQLTVGANIREIRKKSALSHDTLAFEVSVDQAYLSRLEQGHLNPTLLMIERIAKALNVPPNYLFKHSENNSGSKSAALDVHPGDFFDEDILDAKDG